MATRTLANLIQQYQQAYKAKEDAARAADEAAKAEKRASDFFQKCSDYLLGALNRSGPVILDGFAWMWTNNGIKADPIKPAADVSTYVQE
jgi:hypothetical protein